MLEGTCETVDIRLKGASTATSSSIWPVLICDNVKPTEKMPTVNGVPLSRSEIIDNKLMRHNTRQTLMTGRPKPIFDISH